MKKKMYTLSLFDTNVKGIARKFRTEFHQNGNAMWWCASVIYKDWEIN